MVAAGVSKIQTNFVQNLSCTRSILFLETKGREWNKSKKSHCLSDLCWWKACRRNKCELDTGRQVRLSSAGQGVIDQVKLEEDSWR